MNEFNELRSLWVSGNDAENKGKGQPVPGMMLEKLKKLETLQNRVNILKIAVVVLCLISLIYLLLHFGIASAAVYSGLGIIVLGVIFFLWVYMRNQFNIKKLDFTSSTIIFADHAILLLGKQNATFKWPFLIFILSILAGFNLMISGTGISPEDNLKFRLLDSALIALSAFVGYRFRQRRIYKEVTPVIRDLLESKQELSTGDPL